MYMRVNSKVIYFIAICIVVLLFIFVSTSVHIETIPFLEVILRSLLIISFIVFSFLLLKKHILQGNTYLSLYATFTVLCLLEIIFSYIPRSHGTALAKSAKVWHDYYWKTNDWGYRDLPFSKKDSTKKKIVFIGDSFCAGHGITDPDKRFSNIIGGELKHDYTFYNLAKQGHGPNNELQQLHYFPYEPDIVVYQYYMNDIERAYSEVTGTSPIYYSYDRLPLIPRLFVKGSYLINFIYWLYPHDYNFDHRQYVLNAFSNPDVLHAHKKQLEAISRFCQKKNIPLIMVIYPFLDDPKTCTEEVKMVGQLIPKNTLTTIIDMSPMIQSLPIEERIVNKNDAHPSEKVHVLTAEAILLELKKIKKGR